MSGGGLDEGFMYFLDLMDLIDPFRTCSGKLFSALALHSAVPGC